MCNIKTQFVSSIVLMKKIMLRAVLFFPSKGGTLQLKPDDPH